MGRKGEKIFFIYNILLLLLLSVPWNILEVNKMWREKYFQCLHISEKKCYDHLDLILQINTLMILTHSAANFLEIHHENWPFVLFHNAMYIEQRPKKWPNTVPLVIVNGRDGVHKDVGCFVCKAQEICSQGCPLMFFVILKLAVAGMTGSIFNSSGPEISLKWFWSCWVD